MLTPDMHKLWSQDMTYYSPPKEIERRALVIAIDSHRELIETYKDDNGNIMPDFVVTVDNLIREFKDFKEMYRKRHM